MSKYDTIVEKVPRLRKRISDQVLAGSNNSVIVLGSDRKSSPETGHGNKQAAGAMYLAVGRKSEDYDLDRDDSYLYLSMKSDPDDYAGTKFNGQDREVSAALLKSDHVRVVARDKLKIVVGSCSITMSSDGSMVIEGNVKFGQGALDRALKGDAFVRYFMTHTHLDSQATPTSPPAVPPTPDVFSRKVFFE